MTYDKDPRVDAYLAPLPDWQRGIFGRVRDLIHEADPEVEDAGGRALAARRAPLGLRVRWSPRGRSRRSRYLAWAA